MDMLWRRYSVLFVTTLEVVVVAYNAHNCPVPTESGNGYAQSPWPSVATSQDCLLGQLAKSEFEF